MAFKIVCRESSGFCLCLDIKRQSLLTNQKCCFIQMVGRTCLRFIFQKEASFWGWAVTHVSEHCNVLITSQNDTSSLNMFTFKTSGCKNRDSCWSVIGHISHQVQYVNVHILISTAVILNIYNNNWCYRGYANLQLPLLLQLFVPLVLMICATWRLKHLFPLMNSITPDSFISVQQMFLVKLTRLHHEALTHLYLCLFGFSPGRSPISFDHEIVMMNHVYKERFPKVCTAHSHFLLFSLIMCF